MDMKELLIEKALEAAGICLGDKQRLFYQDTLPRVLKLLEQEEVQEVINEALKTLTHFF